MRGEPLDPCPGLTGFRPLSFRWPGPLHVQAESWSRPGPVSGQRLAQSWHALSRAEGLLHTHRLSGEVCVASAGVARSRVPPKSTGPRSALQKAREEDESRSRRQSRHSRDQLVSSARQAGPTQQHVKGAMVPDELSCREGSEGAGRGSGRAVPRPRSCRQDRPRGRSNCSSLGKATWKRGPRPAGRVRGRAGGPWPTGLL